MQKLYPERNNLTYEEQQDLALYDAVLSNDMQQVRHLAAHMKRDLNLSFLVVRKKKHENTNPMNLVSACGHALMLKFLMEAGCEVNWQGRRMKRTPVHMAVLNNNMSCLQLLITARANIDIRDMFGNSPCHYAAELGYCDMLDMMIRIGAKINCCDMTAKTPLMKAVRSNKLDSAVRLVRAGADLSLMDNNKDIALHFAVRNGNAALVNALLSSRSPIETQNKWGRSPLMEAVCYNHREAVESLLGAGCDINRRESKTGETALHVAIRKKYIRIVEALLAYVLTGPSNTMQMLATFDTDIVKYSESLQMLTGQRETLFQLAVNQEAYKTCKLLVALGYIDRSVRSQLIEERARVDQISEDWETLDFLVKAMDTVVPLKQACRAVIRRQIGTDLSHKIPALPVPFVLKDYLLLKSDPGPTYQ